MKAPNEKLTELLFTSYLLQSSRRNEISLYAPSSREEFDCGYDAKFIGKRHCKELYLQFKTPNITRSGFTIYIKPHQHRRLKVYPSGSAYYVSHIFREASQIQDAQLTITSAKAFLNFYIAIDASSLPHDTNFVQYTSYGIPERAQAPTFKCTIHGNTKKASASIARPAWDLGKTLLKKFEDNKIGNYVELRDRQERQSLRFRPINANYRPVEQFVYVDFSDLSEDEEGNYGTAIRQYLTE